MWFQAKNFSQLLIFWDIKFLDKLFIELLNFIHISNHNQNGIVKLVNFSKKSIKRS